MLPITLVPSARVILAVPAPKRSRARRRAALDVDLHRARMPLAHLLQLLVTGAAGNVPAARGLRSGRSLPDRAGGEDTGQEDQRPGAAGIDATASASAAR